MDTAPRVEPRGRLCAQSVQVSRRIQSHERNPLAVFAPSRVRLVMVVPSDAAVNAPAPSFGELVDVEQLLVHVPGGDVVHLRPENKLLVVGAVGKFIAKANDHRVAGKTRPVVVAPDRFEGRVCISCLSFDSLVFPTIPEDMGRY